MRAAVDVDGRYAPHEGLRVSRIGRRHCQKLASPPQAVRLVRRREQPVVADALEARGQHVLQQPADELRAVERDRAKRAFSHKLGQYRTVIEGCFAEHLRTLRGS